VGALAVHLDGISDSSHVLVMAGKKVISKRAKKVPSQKAVMPVFGCMKGTAKALGDIVSPAGLVWHAEGNPITTQGRD
jgi:hypothetical protein